MPWRFRPFSLLPVAATVRSNTFTTEVPSVPRNTDRSPQGVVRCDAGLFVGRPGQRGAGVRSRS